MKKIILPFIIIFIIAISNQSFAVTATVNVTAVRVRESASTSSNIVTNLYEDDEVEILEENEEWYKVKYKEKIGYVKSDFLKKKKETTENPTTETTENTVTEELETNPTESKIEESTQQNQETITTQELNVGNNITLSNAIKIRLVPNLSSNAKIEIAQGTNVTIEAKLGNWYKITDQNVNGWITESKFIKKKSSEESPVETEEQEEIANTTSTQDTTSEQSQETQTNEIVNKTAIVIVDTARVREKASIKSNVIDTLDEDAIVTVIGEEGDFYKITTSKIKSGYVSKTLLRVKDVTSRSTAEERENTISAEANETVNQSLSEGTTTASSSGDEIVQFAKQYLGYPYVLRLQFT